MNDRCDIIAENAPITIRRLGKLRKCYEYKKAFFNRTGNPSHDFVSTMKAQRDDIPGGHG